ncbi:MAG: acylneuraminate cytidylyltransferase family protein [Chloroflexi bacterium]|nr:acylneuraminate cytidylyltransferase family protein [Chloroflexota bacterium]
MAVVTDKPRIVALVPMRHHSERVKAKNMRELADAPLFHHILRTLRICPEIAEIVVDTDSRPIKKGLKAYFPEVVVIDRPVALRGGDIPMNEILLHDTKQVAADFYLQTHSTNPLLRPETLSAAIAAFLGSYPEKDSLFSVTAQHTRLYDSAGKPLNHNPAELLRTQDLPPVFEENSCIYLFSGETLAAGGHRLGKHPMMFPIPAEEAWDIDEELDFQIADFLMRQRLLNE